MLESKAASGEDDINRTKYRFNSERIIPSYLNIAAEQASKALSCWKHRFCQRPVLPLPFSIKSLSFEQLEIKEGSSYNISAASSLTYAWAQRELTCAHMEQLCQSCGRSCSKHPAKMTLRFASRRKEWQAPMALQNKTVRWAELMTVRVAVQVNLHWEIVLAGDWTVIPYHLLQRVD